MIPRLILSWVLLFFLMATAGPRNDDPYDLRPIADMMRFEGVTTSWHWEECGQVNAFYFPNERRVVLCEELKALPPGVIRYVFTHELAHGVIMQRGVPFTGSHEAAADELAAIMLVATGREQDVREASAFWTARGAAENPWDDHPGDRKRGAVLWCLSERSNSWICPVSYDRAVSAWVRLLEME